MQNNYYLPGLNENTSNEYSCVQINRTDTPKIFLLLVMWICFVRDIVKV